MSSHRANFLRLRRGPGKTVVQRACYNRNHAYWMRLEACMPDSIRIKLTATTMEGLEAFDPQVTVEIIQAIPDHQTISRHIIHNFAGSDTVAVRAPDGFPTWQVNIAFSRYDAVTGFFFQPRGDATPTYHIQVTRLPAKWSPQFTLLNSLRSERFQTFKDI